MREPEELNKNEPDSAEITAAQCRLLELLARAVAERLTNENAARNSKA